MRKRLSKYISSFDYFDKSFIVLSVTTGSISIASFATVIGAPVGTAKTSLACSILKGIVKKMLKTRRNEKKKPNKIFMLARSKSSNIESKTFEGLKNSETSHEDIITLMKKKNIDI